MTALATVVVDLSGIDIVTAAWARGRNQNVTIASFAGFRAKGSFNVCRYFLLLLETFPTY
jgi:hypothetical protein